MKNYESFLSTAYTLSFFGGSEEPLLNKFFGDIVKYLKSKYGTKMMVNTNASTLNRKLVDTLVKYGFDNILVSYHAGSKDLYKELMTGNAERVEDNLRYLLEQKEKLGVEKPVVDFNFALQKLNAKEYPLILKKAKELGASAVVVNKYYGGRNRLQDLKVSYDYDVEEGNRILNEIYGLAKEINIRLLPEIPQYWARVNIRWDPENYDASRKCTFPWTYLHFKPVLDDKDCHYVGVCNRIELFKVSYKKVGFKTDEQFRLLWNHPVLQYLRQTVNSKDDINPICKYCKNRARETIRNTDSQLYAEVRDNAAEDFFSEFRRRFVCPEIEGIDVLSKNPSSDDKFRRKIAELND